MVDLPKEEQEKAQEFRDKHKDEPLGKAQIKMFEEAEKNAVKLLREKILDRGSFKANILADYFIQNYQIITLGDTKEIFYYDEIEGIYIPSENLISQRSKEIYSEITKHNLDEVFHHIRCSTIKERKQIEPNKNLIALQNGVFDLSDCSFKGFNSDLIFFSKLSFPYDKNADCLKCKKFFSEVLREDDIILIQEIFGYCLYRDYQIHKAFMFLGEGSNGKSTCLELLRNFLGLDNTISIPLQDLENRFSIANFHNKLANIYADVTDKALYQTGKFKMLTGCDTITAEKKFKEYFSFKNYAKLVFSCNKLPETRDDSDAFFRRWIILHFPNTFDDAKANKNLTRELCDPKELTGLFNWALVGLQRLLKDGMFSNSKSTELIRETYQRLSDSFAGFVLDRVEVASDGFIGKDDFYNAYVEYCKDLNIPAKTKDTISKNITRHIRVDQDRKSIADKRVYCWIGIKLKENGEPVEAVQPFSLFKYNSVNSTIKERKSLDTLDTLDNSSLSKKQLLISELNNRKNMKMKEMKDFLNVDDALEIISDLVSKGLIYEPKEDYYMLRGDKNSD